MTATPADPRTPNSFRELIGRWPRTRDFARDAGCSPLLVRQWRHRNFVPPQYWPGVVAGALRRQIGGVDAELLSRLAASLRGPAPPPPRSLAGVGLVGTSRAGANTAGKREEPR